MFVVTNLWRIVGIGRIAVLDIRLVCSEACWWSRQCCEVSWLLVPFERSGLFDSRQCSRDTSLFDSANTFVQVLHRIVGYGLGIHTMTYMCTCMDPC
jgi:hypothetical protein